MIYGASMGRCPGKRVLKNGAAVAALLLCATTSGASGQGEVTARQTADAPGTEFFVASIVVRLTRADAQFLAEVAGVSTDRGAAVEAAYEAYKSRVDKLSDAARMTFEAADLGPVVQRLSQMLVEDGDADRWSGAFAKVGREVRSAQQGAANELLSSLVAAVDPPNADRAGCAAQELDRIYASRPCQTWMLGSDVAEICRSGSLDGRPYADQLAQELWPRLEFQMAMARAPAEGESAVLRELRACQQGNTARLRSASVASWRGMVAAPQDMQRAMGDPAARTRMIWQVRGPVLEGSVADAHRVADAMIAAGHPKSGSAFLRDCRAAILPNYFKQVSGMDLAARWLAAHDCGDGISQAGLLLLQDAEQRQELADAEVERQAILLLKSGSPPVPMAPAAKGLNAACDARRALVDQALDQVSQALAGSQCESDWKKFIDGLRTSRDRGRMWEQY